MSLKNFLTINGVMFIPFGLMMLLIPSTLFPILNVNLDADGLTMASTVGSMLLSFGLICWIARGENENSVSLRAALLGNLAFHSIDCFLTGRAALSGVMNSMGLVFSVMHFVFAVGFAFYLWKRFYQTKAVA